MGNRGSCPRWKPDQHGVGAITRFDHRFNSQLVHVDDLVRVWARRNRLDNLQCVWVDEAERIVADRAKVIALLSVTYTLLLSNRQAFAT